MSKSIALMLVFILLLPLAVAGTQFINLGKANPMPLAWFPTEPARTPPIITIRFPQNQSYDSTNVLLNFSVSKPETWFSRTELSLQMEDSYMAVVRVTACYYVLDGNENQTFPVDDKFHRTELPEETLNFSTYLTLTEGAHNITVIVESQSAYVLEEKRFQPASGLKSVPVNGSATVNFTIDTIPPIISILTADNKTYGTSGFPLTFTVNEQAAWIDYSLDEQANVTINGNTTLTGIPEDSHNLVIYVVDAAGNTGVSETFYFVVDNTLPSISLLTTENKTYETTDIPLNFTVNEGVSWMAYSLDGQENVTISGNTTLTGLSTGEHNITVYAIDTAGNTGASEMIIFSIPKKIEAFPTNWLGPAIATITIAGATLTIYLVKFKKTTKKVHPEHP